MNDRLSAKSIRVANDLLDRQLKGEARRVHELERILVGHGPRVYVTPTISWLLVALRDDPGLVFLTADRHTQRARLHSRTECSSVAQFPVDTF